MWNREMYSIYKVQTFYWQRTFLVFLNGSVHERHLPNSSEFKSIKISVKTWKHFMLHHESILYSIRSVSKEDKINGILHDIEESPTPTLSMVKLITCTHDSWIYESINVRILYTTFSLFCFSVEIFYWYQKCRYTCLS